MHSVSKTSKHHPSLPGDILLQVFSQLDFETRRQVLPVVCKRWRDELAGASPAWQIMKFQAGKFDEYHKIIRWLKQHGDAALELDAAFSRYPEQPEPEVQSRSWTQYLHGANILPALLPNLQHLKLSCEKSFMVAERDLFSLQILTGLQKLRLVIASDASWNVDTLSPLEHLTALQQLYMEVKDLGSGPMFLAPGLSKLTLLTSLSLRQALSQQPDHIYDPYHAGGVIACLTGLQQLSLLGVIDRIPNAFSNLQHLRTLTVGGHGEEWPGFSVQPSISSCRKLEYLELQYFTAVAEAGWLDAWSALSGLQSLSDIFLESVDLDELASSEWAFGSSLTYLRIGSGYLENFPEALISLTSIRDLGFDMTNLENMLELPVGPYLQHLTSLDLCDTKLAAFPEALSQASKLKRLCLFNDEDWFDISRLEAILPKLCVVDVIQVNSEPEEAAVIDSAQGI
ncbi:hypothetical protein WJX74_001247 [Apatococcus lobatus]|uniref:F-box domain-containing protein n=1 Tax=Apatococcus lobatus TaxID=904363 RepID=A0AAW1RRJ2_9CHLO